MNYEQLLRHIKSYVGAFQSSTIGDYEQFTWWREYNVACQQLIRNKRWLWNAAELDTSPDSDGFITLPFKADSWPGLIKDQQSDDGGSPVIGYSHEFTAFIHDTVGAPSGFERYVPHSFSTDAEYRGTVSGYGAETVSVADASATFPTDDSLVGKAVRFNGEESWYLITSHDATTLYLDRTYQEPGNFSSGQSPADATYSVEPAGCAKLYFPDGGTSVRILYPKRFRPAVNTSDDCGWDSRFDSIMPRMIGGRILAITGGDEESRRKGYQIAGEALKDAHQLYANLTSPPSKDVIRFSSPDSPFGSGSDYTAEGLIRGRSHRSGGGYRDRWR